VGNQVIAWTTNSHAARRGPDPTSPTLGRLLAHEACERAAAVGVTALGGRQQPVGMSIVALDAPALDDLEAALLQESDASVIQATRQRLTTLCERDARVVSAQRPDVGDRPTLFDRLLVVREDEPPAR
jgi:erythromycin esterase-like protein